MQIYEPLFIQDGHQYHTEDGTELQSVTSIIKSGLGIYQYKRVSPKALLGTFKHLTYQYFDEGTLDYDNLDPVIKPGLEQYKLALKEHKIKVLQNEVKRYEPKMLFAGSLDKIAKVNGKYAIIDIKTGKQEAWHKWQTAPYKKLMENELGPDIDRYCLYITDDGFTFVKHDEENNFREFLSIMVVAELKKRNGY